MRVRKASGVGVLIILLLVGIGAGEGGVKIGVVDLDQAVSSTDEG